MKKVNTSALTLALLVIIVVVAAGLTYYLISVPRVTDDAPLRSAFIPTTAENTFTDIEGGEVVLSETFGDYVLVYSWASWCPQCSDGLISLDAFAGQLVGNQEISVIAINRAEDKFTAQRFLNSLPELQNIEIVLDPGDQLFESVEGFAMPEIILFSRSGEVLYQGRGQFSESEILDLIIE